MSVTIRYCDSIVDGGVLVDHAIDTEPGNRASAHLTPVEIEHTREPIRHGFQVVEHDTGDAVFHDLAHGAAIESGDGCPAGHRLGQDETERLPRLGRIEEPGRAAVKLHLAGVIRLAIVDDPVAVD